MVGNDSYPIALIKPFEKVAGHSQADKDLGFIRVRSSPRKPSELIHIGSIIRGALVIKDFQREGDHLVVDTVDADMYMRLLHLHN